MYITTSREADQFAIRICLGQDNYGHKPTLMKLIVFLHFSVFFHMRKKPFQKGTKLIYCKVAETQKNGKAIIFIKDY